MFSNYSYNDHYDSPFFGGSPFGRQRGLRYMTPSQYEYLRRKREEENIREERQRQAAFLEQRRRERLMEQQRQEQQRQRILNRMEEKKRMQQRMQEQQRQPAQMKPKASAHEKTKYVVVQGPDGNYYRVPSSMIRGNPVNTPRWVRKVSHEESDNDNRSFHDAQDTMSVSSSESEYHMAQEEENLSEKNSPSMVASSLRARATKKSRAPAILVEDASDSESEDDLIPRKAPYTPGPGESWMEPVQ